MPSVCHAEPCVCISCRLRLSSIWPLETISLKMYIKPTHSLTHKKKFNKPIVNCPNRTTSFAHTRIQGVLYHGGSERERESFDRSDHLTPNEEDEEKKGGIWILFFFFPKSRQIALGLPTFSLFSHSTFFLLLFFFSLLFWQCFPFFHFLRFLEGALLQPPILMRERRGFSLSLSCSIICVFHEAIIPLLHKKLKHLLRAAG